MSELGEILRSAREKQGLTVLEVARATRIKASYLEALEHGDYAILPGPAYITGFLRNYARVVGLHPDDIVQEYHAVRPMPQPTVKAATRVLANGHRRYSRTRLLWGLATFVLVLAGAYAIKQYNDTYAHSYSGQINVTASALGGTIVTPVPRHASHIIRIRLRAMTASWVRVTADGVRVFQGTLDPQANDRVWTAHRAIYLVTYDGTHLKGRYDGHPMGFLASHPGLIIDLATSSSWHRVS